MIVADDLTGFINGPYKSDMGICRTCFNELFKTTDSLKAIAVIGFIATGASIGWMLLQQKKIDELENRIIELEVNNKDDDLEFVDSEVID